MTAETCSECGWPRRGVSAQECVGALETIASAYGEVIDSVLARDDGAAMIRRRPSPDVWSIAEYVAHTADAMQHIGRRTHLLLTENDPELPRFGDPNLRDYSDADISESLVRLRAACADLLAVFRSATSRELGRTGHNALGTASLLDTASYAVHEAGHHLYDMQNISRRIAST